MKLYFYYLSNLFWFIGFVRLVWGFSKLWKLRFKLHEETGRFLFHFREELTKRLETIKVALPWWAAAVASMIISVYL